MEAPDHDIHLFHEYLPTHQILLNLGSSSSLQPSSCEPCEPWIFHSWHLTPRISPILDTNFTSSTIQSIPQSHTEQCRARIVNCF